GSDGKPLNLVHRDVSSSNILVSYEGAIKLIDFGIARATSRTHQTQVGTLKGKIPYMSPEQCRGLPLDRRSDLFSLGVVMYELTAGRRPFIGENDFQIMDQIVHQGAQPPSSLMRGYPPELEAIVMKLLARKAEDRYQTAEEMLHDLDPFLQQHRLWVSPKPLSRYMRQLFSTEVAAWDVALAEGASLEQHIAQTVVSSHSKQSELVTPPSSFPALMPLSQEMPAVAMPTAGFSKVDAPVHVAPEPVPMPAPDLKRKNKIVFAAIGFVAVVAGGYAGMTAIQNSKKPARAEAAPTPEPSQPIVMPQGPPVPPKPALETTPAVAAVPAKPVLEVEKPKPKPATPVVKPKPKPRPTTTTTNTTTKPVDQPKDTGWDPNSPFLPPSK
ncbi:MAG TPA: protein kinase, partial [Kofleriaceae bacterium]|nr:protein kinase [Kofleriaceae bacterium]